MLDLLFCCFSTCSDATDLQHFIPNSLSIFGSSSHFHAVLLGQSNQSSFLVSHAKQLGLADGLLEQGDVAQPALEPTQRCTWASTVMSNLI